MYVVRRSINNPLLVPHHDEPWQASAAFNWCPIKDNDLIRCVYRAVSTPELSSDIHDHFSSIGYTDSVDGVTFKNRRQLIYPEHTWERYGCEDPRISKIDQTYYIFYTALSNYPFSASGIKVALATTRDFKIIDQKKLVTPFNAKAMALFPEKINGKWTAILSVNTDQPPAKIAIAQFESEADITDEKFWKKWYAELDTHTIDDPRRSPADHIEVGAPPMRVPGGWLLIYSHIQNYFASDDHFEKVFGIEALLLDLENPQKIIGRTHGPIITPNEDYELHGTVPNIVFPSGALVTGDTLDIYYGGADMVCCKASVSISNLLEAMKPHATDTYVTRFPTNPLLTARAENLWEALAVFNPGVIDFNGTIHLLYRAMSTDDTSVCGHATTQDGFTLSSRDALPAYIPRESFEQKFHPGNSGCEDPRLTRIAATIYMCYTAYDGTNPPRVAITSISMANFIAKKWSAWTTPVLISPKHIDDKDACLFPEQINNHYLILHRVNGNICADAIDSLSFIPDMLKNATPIITPRPGMWDGLRVGICAPPIKTKKGWLLLYHGISPNHHTYRVGVALLDSADPTKVLARSNVPIFEPLTDYEKVGQIPNVVFPCGLINRDDTLFIYYGGADSVVAGATVSLEKVLKGLE